MDITPAISKDQYYITSYTASSFRINQELISGSLILMPDFLEAWQIKNDEMLCLKDFDVINRDALPEIILLGTGKLFIPLPLSIIDTLKQENIFIEVMDTPAACRTYNVLLSEGRNVLAMLRQAT